jgi:hypothetical protein
MEVQAGRTFMVWAGEMQETTLMHNRDDKGRLRRSYRALFAATIILAAIGAPLFMQGSVTFAQSMSRASNGGSPSVFYGAGIFALSATPLGLAGYTWKRTQGFREVLDDDE